MIFSVDVIYKLSVKIDTISYQYCKKNHMIILVGAKNHLITFNT